MIPATHSVTIKRLTLTSDGGGGSTETWATLYSFIGHIRELTTQERIANSQLQVKSTHKLYCNQSGITEKDKVVCNSTDYDIKAVRAKGNLRGQVDHYEIELELHV